MQTFINNEEKPVDHIISQIAIRSLLASQFLSEKTMVSVCF